MSKNNKKNIILHKPIWPPNSIHWNFWNTLNECLLEYKDLYNVSHITTSIGFSGKNKIERAIHQKRAAYRLLVAHHIEKKYQNVIDYKVAYLNDLWYFNAGGYAGFSDIAKKDLNRSNSKSIVDQFYEDRIKLCLNQTKYEHNNRKELEQNLPGRFIFVPLQVQKDTVMTLSYISTRDLIRRAIEIAKKTGHAIVFKPHPKSPARDKVLEYLKNQISEKDQIYLSNGNVRELIDRSMCIFTINSGVGFEALLKLKPVYTFGKSDYEVATYSNFKDDYIIGLLKNRVVNEQKIKNFLYNWWQEVIDLKDPDFKEKIKNVFSERL